MKSIQYYMFNMTPHSLILCALIRARLWAAAFHRTCEALLLIKLEQSFIISCSRSVFKQTFCSKHQMATMAYRLFALWNTCPCAESFAAGENFKTWLFLRTRTEGTILHLTRSEDALSHHDLPCSKLYCDGYPGASQLWANSASWPGVSPTWFPNATLQGRIHIAFESVF